MGCNCGGGGGNIESPKVYNGQIEITMVEWFQSIGWIYVGLCGCRDNHKVFQNPLVPKWEVWIHAMGNSVQFRRVYSAADKVERGRGGLANYKDSYDYWVLKSEIQITE